MFGYFELWPCSWGHKFVCGMTGIIFCERCGVKAPEWVINTTTNTHKLLEGETNDGTH